MRFFNVAGPCKPDIHYTLPAADRLDKPEVMSLIEAQKYFILHAPRQTGKTSAILALAAELNAAGRYRAIYVNVEGGQAAQVWVGGYWSYSNQNYNWVAGSWARPPRARAVWAPGGWHSTRRGWMYRPGRWR